MSLQRKYMKQNISILKILLIYHDLIFFVEMIKSDEESGL